jgi:hypothetical protein
MDFHCRSLFGAGMKIKGNRKLATQRVLRALRVEYGVKQRELSRKLKRYETYITVIETGQRECSIPEFFEIVEALGADPVEVFTRIAKW